ncbi:MAG: Na+/H+ antiporter subunit E [Thiothrix sp.]|nr:Na+/H+ antiporter subunit E [Thiothrix sp.]HPQ96232.1 Na+/H+ antiporter subunit E [Thiolinea sp.]
MFSYLRSLSIGLLVFWLLLSGYWDNGLLLLLGVLSMLLVVYLAGRIERYYPLRSLANPRTLLRLPAYWAWLFVEVVKSNIDVARRIWFPRRYPISPVLEQVPMTQTTRLGRTIYANSITLTPGTISVRIMPDSKLLVHALTHQGMDDLKAGEMDRRVTAMGEQ